jgi:hypothetical protein
MADTTNTQQARGLGNRTGQMATIAAETPVASRKVIHATCTRHGGSRGFTNVVMSKIGGTITLDPHATGACVIELDEVEATAMWDQLTEWLGLGALPRGVVPVQAGCGGR